MRSTLERIEAERDLAYATTRTAEARLDEVRALLAKPMLEDAPFGARTLRELHEPCPACGHRRTKDG